jgi:hypothetical protein
VTIRRAHDLQKISDEEFFGLVRIEKNKARKIRKSKGGNPNRTLVARNGRRLVFGVLDAVRADRLVYRDAARILGVSLGRIPSLLRKSPA